MAEGVVSGELSLAESIPNDRLIYQGATPKEAFFVKCDTETTTQDDRNKGIANIEVGFAPLKPAEFVVIKIQQIAGDL